MNKRLASFTLSLTVIFLVLASSFVMHDAKANTPPVENSWVSKASINTARSDLGVASVNGKIYAIGGTTLQSTGMNYSNGGVVGTNEEYDPLSNAWTYQAQMPPP